MDANDDFTAAAKKFDSQLEESVTKINKRTEMVSGRVPALPPAPVHVTAHLEPGKATLAF